MKIVTLALLMLASLGCQVESPDFHYSHVKRLSVDELTEVKRVITTATGSPSPTIAETAFASSHILVLQHAVANTPKGRLATGRTMTKPETFHLLGNGKQCTLLRVKTGQRYPLTFNCVVQSPKT
jgi:hypothetical protein